MSDLKLGILEYGYTGQDYRLTSRLAFTLSLARIADECGYSRFWFTEHHTQNLYIASPEVVIAAIAANTRRIRVGSAGILLHYYSPLKVAEVFYTLSALFPGRIDLGVARGIGATPEAEDLLYDGAPKLAGAAAEAAFERKLTDLVAHLRNGHDGERTHTPDAPTHSLPEMWVMGSGSWSAALAAKLGTKYALALWYQHAEPVDTKAVMADYAAHFQPAAEGLPATGCLSVSGICAETDAEAEAIRAAEQERIGREVPVTFCGSPDRCRASIIELAAAYGVREVVVQAQCRGNDQVERMFRLLAEVMLNRSGPDA
jgi:luciferase family oxidoreductase group 1